MICYVGNALDSSWVEEVAAKRNLEITYIDKSLYIKNQEPELFKDGYHYVIYDLEQYADEPVEIANMIGKVTKAKNSVPIVVAAANFDIKSNMLQTIYKYGIKNIVFGYNYSELKNNLELCLDDQMASRITELFNGEKVEEEAEKITVLSKQKTIGVAGVLHRIGTTTQCMQLVKYIEAKGKKACYIEMNKTDFVKDLKAWFEIESEDTYLGKISCQGIDIFYKENMLSEVLHEPYDYFIYDYGVYGDTDFNRTSFLEKDLRLFVLGTSPGEINAAFEIIKSSFYKNIEYIFNLVSESEHTEILAMMEEKKVHTHFSKYSPDPFVLSSLDAFSSFDKLLNLENIKLTDNKKKGLFKKRKD